MTIIDRDKSAPCGTTDGAATPGVAGTTLAWRLPFAACLSPASLFTSILVCVAFGPSASASASSSLSQGRTRRQLCRLCPQYLQ